MQQLLENSTIDLITQVLLLRTLTVIVLIIMHARQFLKSLVRWDAFPARESLRNMSHSLDPELHSLTLLLRSGGVLT
jgi:hypothetical protein